MPEDEKAHVVVRANYTHGMPMKATVLITIDDDLIEKTVTINGEETIEFDMKKELKFSQKSGSNRYKVEAKVTENLTGLFQSCETWIKIATAYDIRTNPETYVKFERDTTATITVCILIKHTKLLVYYYQNVTYSGICAKAKRFGAQFY